MSSEQQLEERFIQKLLGLKYEYRPDIRDRAALEANFRQKFEELNRVTLTDDEFQRLLDEIVTPDVFASARTLRTINSFSRPRSMPPLPCSPVPRRTRPAKSGWWTRPRR